MDIKVFNTLNRKRWGGTIHSKTENLDKIAYLDKSSYTKEFLMLDQRIPRK